MTQGKQNRQFGCLFFPDKENTGDLLNILKISLHREFTSSKHREYFEVQKLKDGHLKQIVRRGESNNEIKFL